MKENINEFIKEAKKHIKNFFKRALFIFSNTNYRIKYNTIKLKYDCSKADFASINLHKDERILRLEKEIDKLKNTIKELTEEKEEVK